MGLIPISTRERGEEIGSGRFRIKLELLEDLYKQKLAELYDSERQLLRFLPKVIKAVPNEELRTFLQKHTAETRTQCERLEKLLAKRGVVKVKKSKATRGILAEAAELLKQPKPVDPQFMALALTSATQEIEGNEVTCYAYAHIYARLLGFHEDLKPLEQTFQEEKRMEEGLAALAEAMEGGEADSEGFAEKMPASRLEGPAVEYNRIPREGR